MIFNSSVAYRVVVDCSVGYHLSVYSRQDFQYEEKQKYLSDRGIKIREFEDTCTPQQPNSYHVLFKYKSFT